MPAHLRWSLHCSEHEPGHRTCRGVSASRHCEGAWLDMVVPAESWDESELCWAAFLTAGQMGGFLDERITSQNCKWPTIKMKSDTFLSKSILCLALRMMQEAIIHKIKLLQMCFSLRGQEICLQSFPHVAQTTLTLGGFSTHSEELSSLFGWSVKCL